MSVPPRVPPPDSDTVRNARIMLGAGAVAFVAMVAIALLQFDGGVRVAILALAAGDLILFLVLFGRHALGRSARGPRR